MEKVHDEVVANIRACLVSTQGKVTLKQLERDYRTLLGERIPYGKLGHQRLEDFLGSVPTILLTRGGGDGEVFVDAAPSGKSAHISDMVMKQKTTIKKRAKPRNFKFSRGGGGGGYQHQYQRRSPPSPAESGWGGTGGSGGSSWRPRCVPHGGGRGGSRRAAAVSHNQFVQKRPQAWGPPPRLQGPAGGVADRLNVHREAGRAGLRQQDADAGDAAPLRRHEPQQRVRRPNSAAAAATADAGSGLTTNSYQSRTSYDMTGVAGFLRSLPALEGGDGLGDQEGGGGGQEGGALVSAKRRIAKKMSEMSLECDSGTSSPTSEMPRGGGQGGQGSPFSTTVATPDASPRSAASSSDVDVTAVSDFLIEQITEPAQQPYGNGTPELASPASHQPVEFTRTGNDLEDLKQFVKLHNLGQLEMKITEVKGKKYKPTMYHCILKVGSSSYTSYPNDFKSQTEAERYCASQALADLMERRDGELGRRSSGPRLLSANADILARVPPMLERHQHGIWSWQLEEDYAALHGELLPANWLEVVDTSDRVSIERVLEKYVLRHCDPGKKGQLGSPTLDPEDVSVPSNTVQFGEDGRLFAQVTCVVSVGEIWCCQYDTPEYEAYTDAMARMERFYERHGAQVRVSPGQVHTNSFCVARLDDAFHRVKVFRVSAEGEAACFCIDSGDIYSVPCADLHQMRSEFANLQAQAFLCRLVGLESFQEVSMNCKELQAILYKEVVLEALFDEDLGNNSSDKNIPVIMCYEDDPSRSINEEFIQVLAAPKLDKEGGGVSEVVVSHVESNGDVYVQVPGPGLGAVQELLRDLGRRLRADPAALAPAPQPLTRDSCPPGRLFLLRARKTDRAKADSDADTNGDVDGDGDADEVSRWRRVRLIDWSPRGDLAQTYCVDVGSTDVIRPGAERLLPLAGEALGPYPDQAVRVRLSHVTGDGEVPPDFVEHMRRLLPPSSRALLKVTPPTLQQQQQQRDHLVTCVELFKRSAEGGLFCINKAIAMQHQLTTKEDGANKKRTTFTTEDKENEPAQQQQQQLPRSQQEAQRGRLPLFAEVTNKNVPSGGCLPAPDYPKAPSEYFNVMVPFAVNPWNFVVQPLDSSKHLQRLMEDMQQRYAEGGCGGGEGGHRQRQGAAPLRLDEVRPGAIYASRHEDGVWYRTSVLKVIHSASISVFYCDFGYYANLSLHQLLPLEPELLRLPYQALKARLHGIKPRHQKWTMEDCKTFKEMVRSKAFVSVVKAIDNDELYKSDIVLELILIDTTTESDQYVHKELIRRDIAVAIED